MPTFRTAPSGWKAPAPLAVLDWQRRQEAFTRTNLNQRMLELSITGGNWTIRPAPATGADLYGFSAQILMLTESDRLRQARTYSIGPGATGLAVAAASRTAPREPISTRGRRARTA